MFGFLKCKMKFFQNEIYEREFIYMYLTNTRLVALFDNELKFNFGLNKFEPSCKNECSIPISVMLLPLKKKFRFWETVSKALKMIPCL